jgi:sulfate transport system substrate-binding protein
LGPGKFDIVIPSISILAEPPVAVVERDADRHGTNKVAEEYLKYLYSDEGQEIIAKNYYRPRNQQVAQKYADILKPVNLFTINEIFGGWQAAQKKFFADGGVFDQIYIVK